MNNLEQQFALRRARVMDSIGAGGVAIIHAAPQRTRNSDVEYRYRQNSDFLYLTGFDEPQAVAVLAPGRPDGEFVLFCRDRDPDQEVWTGFRAGPQGACECYGADQAFVISEFGSRLPQLLADRQTLYYSLGRQPDHDRRVVAAINGMQAQGRSGVDAPSGIESLDNVLHPMRLFKNAAEIAAMRTAGKTSARAHCRAMQACAPGKYEYQIAAALHYEFEYVGMQPAYPSIVGSGRNGCILHYIENASQLRDGDMLLIDAAAEQHGYASDITRSFPVNGQFTGPQRAVYDIVLDAQLAAIDAVQVGHDYDAPNRVATRILCQGLLDLGLLEGSLEQVLDTQSYRRFYMHGTGHWLGLDVHDVGDYKIDGDWRLLAPGMTLTVEPGLYIQAAGDVDPRFHDIGIRIEDDIHVTADGPDVLSAGAPKAIDEIEALMASSV